MTEFNKYETIPTSVEATKFDGSVECAQAILEWAESNNVRGVMQAGGSVAIELNIAGNVILVTEGEWLVKDPSAIPAYYIMKYDEETFSSQYREPVVADG